MAVYASPLNFHSTHFINLSSSCLPCTKQSLVVSSCSLKVGTKPNRFDVGWRLVHKTKLSNFQTLKRSCSNDLDNLSDDELSDQIQELSKRLNLSNENEGTSAVAGDMSNVEFVSEESEESQTGILDYCSAKKAFSSMVFMIRELQSYALHIREHLTREDLQAIMGKVQREMNASFVWLFQQVFSQTPTLMVYVMILMANFTVHSMTHNANASVAQNTVVASQSMEGTRVRRDGDGEKFKWKLTRKELRLWNSIVDEVVAMQERAGGFTLDGDTMKRLVLPMTMTVDLEKDHYEEYFRTDLLYQMGISRDPNNALLLANYAQFLYRIAHDHERAEECFKRAVMVDPPDSEALSSYADFLCDVKKEMWEAEERYIQAIEVDPTNWNHVSKYALFLWRTGAKDTCLMRQQHHYQDQDQDQDQDDTT